MAMPRKPTLAVAPDDERETLPERLGPLMTVVVVPPHERRRRIIEELLMRRGRAHPEAFRPAGDR
jgi:hypothetical protein